jgi:hypothetical protein
VGNDRGHRIDFTDVVVDFLRVANAGSHSETKEEYQCNRVRRIKSIKTTKTIKSPMQKDQKQQHQYVHNTKSIRTQTTNKNHHHHHHRTWTNPQFLNRARVRSVPRPNCHVSNPGCRNHSSIPSKRGLHNEWGLNLKERKEEKKIKRKEDETTKKREYVLESRRR